MNPFQHELDRFILNGSPPTIPVLQLVLIGALNDVFVYEFEFSVREYMEVNAHPEIWGSFKAVQTWQYLRLAHMN